MGYKGGIKEQVSNYLLKGFVCQKESSISLWQNTPEHGATKGDTAGKDRRTLLCPCHSRVKHRAHPGTDPQHTQWSQCHLYRYCALGVTSDVGDPTVGTSPPKHLLLHFPGKHFQENTGGVYVAEALFQRKRCPVRFLGSGLCQKPQDRHSGY